MNAVIENPISDKVIILWVDDRPELVEQDVLDLRDIGGSTLTAETLDDAIQQVRQSPTIDLVVTDICLDPGDTKDRGGVTLAATLRASRPDLPVIGYSSQVETLKAAEKNPFTETHIRGSAYTLKENMEFLQDLLNKAVEHKNMRQQRYKEGEAEASEGTNAGSAVGVGVATGVGFKVRRHFQPSGNDETSGLQSELKVLDVNSKLLELGIHHPLSVWIRSYGDGSFEAQLYYYSPITAHGNTESEAIVNLVEKLRARCQELIESQAIEEEERYLKWLFEITS